MYYPNTQPQTSSPSTVKLDVPVPSTSDQVHHKSPADVTFPCVSIATNVAQGPISVPIATCASAVPRVSIATTTSPIGVPIATCTSAVPCVSTATTAAQGPISVPLATCTTAVTCVSTTTIFAQGPISVPVATCASTVPCVSRTASTVQDPLNDPVVSSSVLPHVSTETFAQSLPTLRISHGVF